MTTTGICCFKVPRKDNTNKRKDRRRNIMPEIVPKSTVIKVEKLYTDSSISTIVSFGQTFS